MHLFSGIDLAGGEADVLLAVAHKVAQPLDGWTAEWLAVPLSILKHVLRSGGERRHVRMKKLIIQEIKW